MTNTESTASHVLTVSVTHTLHQQYHITPCSVYTQTHTLSACPSEAKFRQEMPGTPGEPLTPPHLNHDIVTVNIGTVGTLGAGGTGFPSRLLPHLHSGAGRAGYSRNELDLEGRASPGLPGPRSLCRGCKPGAVFAALFGSLSRVLRATWVPSTPVSVSHLGAPSAGSRLQARVLGGQGPGAKREIAARSGAKLVGEMNSSPVPPATLTSPDFWPQFPQ